MEAIKAKTICDRVFGESVHGLDTLLTQLTDNEIAEIAELERLLEKCEGGAPWDCREVTALGSFLAEYHAKGYCLCLTQRRQGAK